MTSKAQDIKGDRREGFFTSESASGLVRGYLCPIRHKHISRSYPFSGDVGAEDPGIQEERSRFQRKSLWVHVTFCSDDTRGPSWRITPLTSETVARIFRQMAIYRWFNGRGR